MKILIAVGSKEYSGPTLRVGMKVSHAFKASTTIVDVGEKVSSFNTKVVGLAQDRMESWNFNRPGVEVLEWAFEFLAEKKFIEPKAIEAGFPKNTLVDTGGNRSEVYLKGTVSDEVSLILRNGEIISELRDEVQSLGIIGEFATNLIAQSTGNECWFDILLCAVVDYGIQIGHPLRDNQVFDCLCKFFRIYVLRKCRYHHDIV